MKKGSSVKVTKEKEISSVWLYNDDKEEEEEAKTALIPPSRNGTIDSFDFDLSDVNECCNTLIDTNELIRDYKKLLYSKLRIGKLNGVSIPPTANNISHILNLKQEFTFPQSNLTAQRDKFTQTIKPTENRIKTPYPYEALCDLIEDQAYPRPQSFPMAIPSNHNMKYACFDFQLKNNVARSKISTECIGDSIDNDLKQIKCNLLDYERKKEADFGMTSVLPSCQNSVQCVIVKPKNQSTPTFKCKKPCQRPQTKQLRKREMSRNDNQNDDESVAIINVTKNNDTSKKPNSLKENKMDVVSSSGTMDFCNVGGSTYLKLCTIVEQLQDFDWEVCINGLRNFIQVASHMNWDSDLGSRFIPIINRKLIDFFRSPRSVLCRTACQVAGEFFIFSKSTKRPEFDEMVDILLNKASDPNRFIKKDANTALDKMASSISVHHAVRAICAKATNHKNAIVRATAARVLTEACIRAGNEQIIGADANPRTRKRVMSNLAKFLLDKNIETRKNGEHLCRVLKGHKFFMEYFFKDIENNLKNTLKKIILQIR